MVAAVRDSPALGAATKRRFSWGSTRDLLMALRHQHRDLAMDMGGAGGMAAHAPVAVIQARQLLPGGLGSERDLANASPQTTGSGGAARRRQARKRSVASHYSDAQNVRLRRISELLGDKGLQTEVPEVASVTQQLLWDASREASTANAGRGEAEAKASSNGGGQTNRSDSNSDSKSDSDSDGGNVAIPEGPSADSPKPNFGGWQRKRRKSAVDRLSELAGILGMGDSDSTVRVHWHTLLVRRVCCVWP